MKPIRKNWSMLFAIVIAVATAPMCQAWQSSARPTGSQSSARPTGSQSSGRPTGSQSSARPTGSQSSGQVEEAEMSADVKAFRELRTQIGANQVRIDQLFRTLPIGFPERRKAFKDEIERLTAVNTELKKEIFAKAKAAFASSDRPTMESTKVLQKRLAAMLSPTDSEDRFNPEESLELISMLREKFPDSPPLLKYEFDANYAIERFENAEKALLRLEKAMGADFSKAKQDLKDTMDKYQQELMIRRLEANTDDLPRVLLVTTEGDIVIELFENHAPNTVANFIHLVRDQKFYDGKLFHLVKPGEYAMTGSPNGDGMGDAGYRIPCECYEGTIRSHFRGTLSMMAPTKDRGGSQFFIMTQPNPHTWDGKYTAFGRVIEGMDVALKLQYVDKTTSLASSAAVSKITRAEVLRSRSHAYMPKKIAQTPSFSGLKGSGSSGTSGSGSSSTKASESTEEGAEATGSFDLLLQGSGKK